MKESEGQEGAFLAKQVSINAPITRWNEQEEVGFQLLNREHVKPKIYAARGDPRADFQYYIEMFYNTR